MNFLWDNIFRRSRADKEMHTVLTENILFQDLSERELRFLEAIVHVRRFHSGEPVFRQGEIGVGMYIIIKGRVEIFVTDDTSPIPEARDIFITQLVNGDFFGELSLVEENGRRTATALARDETVLVGFFKPDMMEVISRSPQTGIKILFRLAEVLGKRLKETTEKVSDLRRALKELRNRRRWMSRDDRAGSLVDNKLRAVLHRERIIKLTAFLFILLASLVVLLAVDNLLISFVLAFVMNYLLTPIVTVLERRGLPRQTAILIPFIAMAALIAFGIYSVLPLISQQVALLESQLPKYQVDLMNLVASTEQRFKFLKYANVNFTDTTNTWIINKTAEISSALPSAVSGSLTVLLLSPFFAYFMLQDGRQVSRRLLSLVPNNIFEVSLNLQHELNEQMGGFIRARFLEAAIVGFVVWVGLQISGFPYASLLGLFAGVTNLIPYLGPIIGAVPAVLIALISEDAMITQAMSINLIVVSSIYFLAQLIDIVFIIPFVVARIVNLHPVTVIIVIIIGSQLMGILGMVISIPVASAIKLIFRAFYDHILEIRA